MSVAWCWIMMPLLEVGSDICYLLHWCMPIQNSKCFHDCCFTDMEFLMNVHCYTFLYGQYQTVYMSNVVSVYFLFVSAISYLTDVLFVSSDLCPFPRRGCVQSLRLNVHVQRVRKSPLRSTVLSLFMILLRGFFWAVHTSKVQGCLGGCIVQWCLMW
jgi:hypothetical protein